MAYEIVKRLSEQSQTELLLQLEEGVSARERKRGKIHEVFEPSFDWKECVSNKFIDQKLDYIHGNPCKGIWNLVESVERYEHSSAKFYLTSEQGVYEVMHCGKLEDIDLTKRTEG